MEDAFEKVEQQFSKVLYYRHINSSRLTNLIQNQKAWPEEFPPYQVFFDYINSINFLNNAIPSLRPLPYNRGVADVDLYFHCILEKEGLIFQLEYRNKLFDCRMSEGILQQYMTLCKNLVNAKEDFLSRVNLAPIYAMVPKVK